MTTVLSILAVFAACLGWFWIVAKSLDAFEDRRQRRLDRRSIRRELDEAAMERHRPKLAAIAHGRR